MEFFLTVIFLVNGTPQRVYYQFASLAQCEEARRGYSVESEAITSTLATVCTTGKAPKPTRGQLQFENDIKRALNDLLRERGMKPID